jgi:8-oxo-dGTP diphosphatase
MIVENSAKAIIVRNSTILLIHNKDQYGVGDWFCLPGGRQRPGENIQKTLERECKEEISVVPVIEELLFIREYIHHNHELHDEGENSHKIEFMFLCHLKPDDESELNIGEKPDIQQKKIEWVSIDRLSELNIFPRKLRELRSLLNLRNPIYWGDIL